MEGPSKRDASSLTGRTDTMKRVVFPDVPMAAAYSGSDSNRGGGAPVLQAQPGDYVAVEVRACWRMSSMCTLSCKLTCDRRLRDALQSDVHGPMFVHMCVPAFWSLADALLVSTTGSGSISRYADSGTYWPHHTAEFCEA